MINTINPIFGSIAFTSKPITRKRNYDDYYNRIDSDIFVSSQKQDELKAKKYAVMFFDKDVLKSIYKGDENNPKLKSLICELTLDEKLRENVFNKIDNALDKVLETEKDENTKNDLLSMKLYLAIIRQELAADKDKNSNARAVAFKGDFTQYIGERMVPGYKMLRSGQQLLEGNPKAAVKSTLSAIDNTMFQSLKQTVAGTAAAKGAAIGGVLGGQAGSLIGSAVGYLGTILLWGTTRNKIVDIVEDKYKKMLMGEG